MAIISRIVTIKLPYINLALKSSYWTGICLSNIIIDGTLAKKRGGKTTLRVGELGEPTAGSGMPKALSGLYNSRNSNIVFILWN